MMFSSNQDEAAATVTVALLLEDTSSDTKIVEGVVDYRGNIIVNRSKYGGWRSASFIISAEIAERFAYRGITSNLMTYLIGPLHLSTLSAATNINVWTGVVLMLPIVGALLADSYLGRYRMILFSSLLYTMGLGLLTLSTFIGNEKSNLDSDDSPSSQVIIFFISLYLVAIGQAGHRPCVQAFGADQFDVQDPEESKTLSSFFNWWYFGVCAACVVSIIVLNYIQDNLNWGLGFGVPCVAVALSLVVFLIGTKTYRYSFKKDEKNPVSRLYQVFAAAARNWRRTLSSPNAVEEAKKAFPHITHKFKFLDKALIQSANSDEEICSTDVEEAKQLLQMLPVWAACLIYAVVYAQLTTVFTKQGSTLDRSVGSNFKIPAASMQVFTTISVVLLIPIYDRLFVPLARAITAKPSGISMLQRIGCGIVFSMVAMVVAAAVETRRLKIALDSGYADVPTATIPMSVWWLVPQYILIGVSEVFTMIGMQEFFYDQMPTGLKSFGTALYLSTMGAGSFLSGLLISFIQMATSWEGREGWFSNNLNRAHLDYFYWFVAGLCVIDVAFSVYVGISYVCKRDGETD